jgi:hypothetical protein
LLGKHIRENKMPYNLFIATAKTSYTAGTLGNILAGICRKIFEKNIEKIIK